MEKLLSPPLTWSSDVASVIHAGFKPVFVDIDIHTLGMNTEAIISKINKNTKSIFELYTRI